MGPTVPARAQNRLANCSIEAHVGLSPAKDPLLGRRWLREARAPARKKESSMRSFDSIVTSPILITPPPRPVSAPPTRGELGR
jgi:hypothetical protein